jgi:hypothetical protein
MTARATLTQAQIARAIRAAAACVAWGWGVGFSPWNAELHRSGDGNNRLPPIKRGFCA